MKKRALAVTIALLLSVIAASQCYAQQLALVVNIPFAFQVGGKTLPAGEYRVLHVSTRDRTVQRIERTDNLVEMTVLTIGVDQNGREISPKLIFNRYGDTYFLSQMWSSDGLGRQFFQSGREKELARTTAKIEVALPAHSSSVREKGR